VKRTLFWLIVAAVLVIGLVLYRSRSGSNLNVTPDAEREIEKAKRR
jgi:preprotein translocase subunit SecG